jgi:hypothetical protein
MTPSRFQLTVLDLALVIILAACVVTATRSSPMPGILIGLIVYFLLVVGLLAISVLGIIFRNGPKRAFWLGFLGFGLPLFVVFCGYFFLASMTGLIVSGLGASARVHFFLGTFLMILPFATLGGTIAKRFVARPPDPPVTRQEGGPL